MKNKLLYTLIILLLAIVIFLCFNRMRQIDYAVIQSENELLSMENGRLKQDITALNLRLLARNLNRDSVGSCQK